MGKIAILLFTTPFQFQNSDTAVEFIKAALEKGHEVTVIGLGDGVYNVAKFLIQEEMPSPVNKFREMTEHGVKFVNCFPCVTARGLSPEEDFIPSATIESTTTVLEIMQEADRFFALMI
ncbi:MAG: DsrE/DsrF/TusD sulfur relay family protein [Candidatus Jordarchaeum sp.]|uniref:DsrE/DsrF/TusD sulfur relay family protein n=1 Tax=Candidatus Jordarchaeum sp. TaxID=2823881 RepID=UPI00404A9124